ncbi:MAG TPA: hypothetical protein VKU60_09470 [Chloroflexota bacterium]|nr:hypothetical protein [Chloroflexota bacterium]
MERPNSMKSVEPEGTSFTPAPQPARAPKRSSHSKLTEWQRFFLTRLDYLLSVQRSGQEAEAALAQLLSKAVYSTYLDCQTQGVGDEALQRITAGSASTPSAN